MKQNFLRRLTTIILCSIISITPFASIKAFASLDDIETVGGRYDEIVKSRNEYKIENPDDTKVYECHHLISREALNLWGDDMEDRFGSNSYNEFIVEDLRQNWAPSIIMEKADHEKTLSYYNKKTRTEEQNLKAVGYINRQAQKIIEKGDVIGVLVDETKAIKKLFGDKYNRALQQMWEYVRYLNFRHTDSRTLVMDNPDRIGWYLCYKFGR